MQYKCKWHVAHNGTTYLPGSIVELSLDEAREIEGAIEPLFHAHEDKAEEATASGVEKTKRGK